MCSGEIELNSEQLKLALIIIFYCGTIAYHVGLNAVLGWPPGKQTFIVGCSLRLSSRDLPHFSAIFYLYLSSFILLDVLF